MELIGYLDRGHALDPQADCLVSGSRRWSYADVVQKTHRIAAAIERDGFAPGAKFAVLSPNDPEAFIAILGGVRARLTWLPINPRYSIEDIVDLLSRFECELLILHDSFASQEAAIRRAAPKIRTIVSLGSDMLDAELLDDWLAAPGSRHDRPPPGLEEVAAILATGGTTGQPKGVMQTHRGFATYVANHMIAMWHSAPPRYLIAAPMTHAAGFMAFPMLARGGTIFVLDGAQPQAVARAMVENRITDIFLPPTVIYMMLADEHIRSMQFPALKYLLYGAAPMSVDKLREALTWLGPVMVQGFGQVEAFMLCTVLGTDEHYINGAIADDSRLSSCGRPAAFSTLAIMDEEGELLGDGEVGELVVRAGNVMKGYFKNEAATAEASRFGWHHTGDIAYRDPQGFYHLVDRSKDVIISGGLNIYPSEIEQILWAHPAVQDCAVIGAPDEKWGEAVTAVVQLKQGEQVDPEQLIALCRDRLGSIKAPKKVVFWPDLPRSPVGKVLKRTIRDSFWNNATRRI